MKFVRIYKFIKYENLFEAEKMADACWKVSEMCVWQKQRIRELKAFGNVSQGNG